MINIIVTILLIIAGMLLIIFFYRLRDNQIVFYDILIFVGFFLIIFATFFCLYNCSEEKVVNQNESSYPFRDTLEIFDINRYKIDAFYQKDSSKKYKLNTNDDLYKYLSNELNFYEIYFCSSILKNENIEVFTLYCYYDYVSAILLITQSTANKKVISFEELSYIGGDGDDFWYSKSKLIDDLRIIRNDTEGYYKYDTLTEEKVIKSTKLKLIIQKDGKIKVDTIR